MRNDRNKFPTARSVWSRLWKWYALVLMAFLSLIAFVVLHSWTALVVFAAAAVLLLRSLPMPKWRGIRFSEKSKSRPEQERPGNHDFEPDYEPGDPDQLVLQTRYPWGV